MYFNYVCVFTFILCGVITVRVLSVHFFFTNDLSMLDADRFHVEIRGGVAP